VPGRLLTLRTAAAWLLAALAACVPPSRPLDDPAAACEGFCPVLCDGSACPAPCDGGACEPAIVAGLPDATKPSGLAIAGDQAFVCDRSLQAALHRVSLLDGRSTVVTVVDGSCPAIALDPQGQRLLWFIDEARFGEQPLALWSQPIDAKIASVMVNTVRPVAVATRHGEALWSGHNGGVPGLFVVRDGASVPVDGMTGTTLPGAIAVGPDGRIFVAWPEVKNISVALDPDGTGARLLVDGKRTDRDPLEPSAMAADTSHLYYGMDGALWRVGVAGQAPPERVAPDQPRIVGIVVDEQAVYWVEATRGSLFRLVLSTRRVELLATGVLQARDLNHDQANLYWLDPPRRALLRLEKPR
jgi:hypothetical protein